jgi:hypothetical protein
MRVCAISRIGRAPGPSCESRDMEHVLHDSEQDVERSQAAQQHSRAELAGRMRPHVRFRPEPFLVPCALEAAATASTSSGS